MLSSPGGAKSRRTLAVSFLPRFWSFFWPERWSHCLITAFLLSLLILIYVEIIHYALVIGAYCKWPGIETSENASEIRRFYIASDTHLLDRAWPNIPVRIIDEFSMRKSYFAAVKLIQPQAEATFVLGDLADTGEDAADEQEYADFRRRFDLIFQTGNHNFPPVYPVFGNHDIGGWSSPLEIWRNEANERQYLLREDPFPSTTFRQIRIGALDFILLNSMALSDKFGDNCSFCQEALKRFENFHFIFPQQPILIQHVPLFRLKDSVEKDESCQEDILPNAFSLSENVSDLIVKKLKPRLVFAGHVHQSCHTKHDQFDEFTIEPMTWHMAPEPSITLLVVNDQMNQFAVTKCDLPRRWTVILIYCLGFGSVLLWLFCRWALFKSASLLTRLNSVQTEDNFEI